MTDSLSLERRVAAEQVEAWLFDLIYDAMYAGPGSAEGAARRIMALIKPWIPIAPDLSSLYPVVGGPLEPEPK